MNTTICMVLAIFCLQYGRIAANADEWTYRFSANTSIRHRISDEYLSQWLLSGNLVIQNFGTYKTMKLVDVKTIGYHGPNSDTLELEEVTVPEASGILSQQFVAHYNLDKLESVSFMPKEPVWSMNIKKAIAGSYQADLNGNADDVFADEEQNIFGNCKVNYEKLPHTDNHFEFMKRIDTGNCEMPNDFRPLWKEVRYGSLVGSIERRYVYEKEAEKSGGTQFVKIESTSNFTYKLLRGDLDKYIINQTQYLKLSDVVPIQEKIDISKVTNQQKPAYEYEEEILEEEQGEMDTNLMTKWQTLYENLDQWMIREKSEDVAYFGKLEELQSVMSSMNVNTLNIVRDAKYEDDQKMLNMFFSLLPTLGTHNSVQFIKLLIKQKAIADVPGMRAVAMYPFYQKTPNARLIKEMEEFLDLAEIGDKMVKQAYILSFSNLVGALNKHIDYARPNIVYKRVVEQYVDKYYNLYAATQDYNLQMQYILGMMNMGPLATHYLVSIAQNTTSPAHVRVLATNAISRHNYLERPEPFQRFWPIVLDHSEDFELRVAALNLLLEAPSMDPSEIYAIFRYMNETSDDPVEQHLFNCFYTTMTSGRPNWEGSRARSAELVETITSQLRKPISTKGLRTANYFSGFKNEFGSACDTHLVAEPHTNFFRSVHFSWNDYLEDQRLNSYALYIRLADGFRLIKFRQWADKEEAVEDLYKILQLAKVALDKPLKQLHLEFALFYDNRAVLSLFVNEATFTKRVLEHIMNDLFMYFINNDIIRTDQVSRMNFVSDLGTPISVGVRKNEIYSTRYTDLFGISDNPEKMHNITAKHGWSYTTDLKSVNPVTNVNHGLIDVYANQAYLKLKVFQNKAEQTLKWRNEDVYYDNLLQRKPALYVESGNNAEAYCPNCTDLQFLNAEKMCGIKDVIEIGVGDIGYNITYNPAALIDEPVLKQYGEVDMPNGAWLLWYEYSTDYLFYHANWDIHIARFAFVPSSCEPSEYVLNYEYDVKSNSKDKLDVAFDLEINLTETLLSDNTVLYYKQLNFSMHPAENSYHISLELDENGSYSYNIHSKLEHMTLGMLDDDKFALTAADPFISKTSILYKDATDATTLDIATLFYVSTKQQHIIKQSADYRMCVEDAAKHFPSRHSAPTSSCYRASSELSTYDQFSINVEVQDSSDAFFTFARNILAPKLVDARQAYMKNFSLSVFYSATDGNLTGTMTKTSSVQFYKALRSNMLMKPKAQLYNLMKHDIYGVQSYCIITPHQVKTFTEKTVMYDMATTMVPLIECNNKSRVGMVTRRSNDAVDFKLWLDGNVFLVEMVESASFSLKINDEIVENNISSDDYSVKFLADNSLILSTETIDIYYNQDYVSVGMSSILIRNLCGICSTGILTAPNMITEF